MTYPVRYLQEHLLTLDEGKGSAYERYALNLLLFDILNKYPIDSVLELPANGVMGVPGIKSLICGVMKKKVTLVNPAAKAIGEMRKLWHSLKLEADFVVSDYYQVDALESASFDLVWNFCVAEHFDDPQAVIKEMKRLTRKYILIPIQNVFNLGYPMHKLYHRIKNEPWDHGRFDRVKISELVRWCEKLGLRVIKVGGVDMPPWPDINMKLGESGEEKTDFSEYGEAFAALRPSVHLKEINRIVREWQAGEICKYPWWMWGMVLWYYFIEKPMPEFIKIYVSHHPYILAEKI